MSNANLLQLVDFASAVVISRDMIPYGFGRHVMYLQPENIVHIGKRVVPIACMWIFTACLPKFAVAMMITKILVPYKHLKCLLYSLLSVLTVMSIVNVIVEAIQCIPLAMIWDPTVKGSCISTDIHVNVAIVTSCKLSPAPSSRFGTILMAYSNFFSRRPGPVPQPDVLYSESSA